MSLIRKILLFQCLSAVISHYIAGQGDGHFHLNSDRIQAQNYLKYVLNYYLTDDKSKLNYTRWFFSPHENIKLWSGAGSRAPTYIFQNRDRSHLFNKFPQIYNSLEGVSVDFFNKNDDNLDPYSSLHSEEEKLVSENPSEVSKEAMWLNIRSVFSQSKTGKTNEKIGTFLYRKLGRSGIVLYLQTFQYYRWNNPETGVNIVGVLPGLNWASKKDKPIIVASHWDIRGAESEEYGTGLASILETVRVLMADDSFRSINSVIFVAFDKNHDGKIGSKRFISDYLLPHIVHKYGCRIQGIISLELDKDVNQLIPVTNNQAWDERGSALVSRGTTEELRLTQIFQRNLVSSGSQGVPFTFQELNTNPANVKDLEYYSGIWNNDVGRFWFDEETKHVPTLMITKYRNPWRRQSAMDDSGQNLEMLTTAVINTIKQLSQGNQQSEPCKYSK